MKRRAFLSTTTAIGTIAITGCQSSNDTNGDLGALLGNNSTEDSGNGDGENSTSNGDGSSKEPRNPYKSVVRENVRALENENLELLKQTIHKDAPIYERTIEETQRLWSQYDLTYELEELAVTKEPEGGTATAAFQTMQIQQGDDCEEEIDEQSFQIQQEEDCEKEAHVRFIQVTRKESGPEFRDNRTEGRHILRSSNDDWKIWDTEVINVERL